MIAARIAWKKNESIVKTKGVNPLSQLVRASIAALMTIENRPRVRHVIGAESEDEADDEVGDDRRGDRSGLLLDDAVAFDGDAGKDPCGNPDRERIDADSEEEVHARILADWSASFLSRAWETRVRTDRFCDRGP